MLISLGAFGTLDARAVGPGSGRITVIAGVGTEGSSIGSGGVATASSFGRIAGAVADPYGNVFVADAGNCLIRKVDLAGLVSTVAGDGTCGFGDGGGSAASARLSSPSGLVIDNANNLYIAETDTCVIRRITSEGAISIVAGVAPIDGVAQCGYNGEGVVATGARLNGPTFLAFDSNGNLAFSDTGNCAVRRVNVKANPPVVTTIVGALPTAAGGTCAAGGEIVRALGAPLLGPAGLAYDPAGNLFVAEQGANRVRRVGVGGNIWTVVGGGTGAAAVAPPYGDGGGPTLASLTAPMGLATDAAGAVFIADSGHCRVRALTGNQLTTVAGSSCGNAGDRGPASVARLSSVASVSVNRGGDLLIGDAGNFQVWRANGVAAPISGAGNAAQHSTLVDQFRTFGNANTGAWSGGDATYSLVLPGNRVLWLFADSWIGGTVNADHSRNGQLLIHNQVVIQDDPSSPTLRNAFRPGAPAQPVFVSSDPSMVLWPAAPVLVDSNTVQVTLRRVNGATGGIEGIDLATVTLDPFDVVSIDSVAFDAKAWVPTTCPNGAVTDHTQFGAAITSDGAHTYIYGIENCGLASDFLSSRGYMHLARVAGSDLTAPWEYYAGTTPEGAAVWSATATDTARLGVVGSVPNAGEEYSVVRTAAGTYRMVTSALTIGGIKVFTSPAPEGPWTLSSTVWPQTPESNLTAYGDTSGPGTVCRLWTYGTKEHPAFNTSGRITISYNVGLTGCADPQRVLDQFANVDNYRPRFVTAG
jgi:hypothetical protein